MPTPPAFILIEPQMGENIGAAARAMKNFGLTELRIVAPRDGWPNPAAEAMAAHGVDIVHAAKVFETTREAVADLHYIYASTARNRWIRKPQLDPREAAADAKKRTADEQKTGIMFGPERSGLSNEDIAEADAILTIPTDPNSSSLNIAQSAVVIAYEWWVGNSDEWRVTSGEERGQQTDEMQEHFTEQNNTIQRATHDEIAGFFEHLESALDKTYFFKKDEKKPRMWQNLRSTFLRADFTTQEVQSLRGVISALEKKR